MGSDYSKCIDKIKEYSYKEQIKIVEKTIVINAKDKQEISAARVYVRGFTNNPHNGYGVIKYNVTNDSNAGDTVVYEGN